MPRRRIPIHTSVWIDTPRERVWNVLIDLDRQTIWMRDAIDIRLLGPGPLRLGTRLEVPTRVTLLRITDVLEVTGFDPPIRFAVRHEGPVRGEGEFMLIKDGDATELHWTEELEPPFGVLGEIALSVLAPIIRRTFRRDLRRLRRLVEHDLRRDTATG